MSLRRLVSKKKRRFTQDGFDLDLVYINERLICMGYPATAIEASYRNPLREVQRFFDTYHPGHFWIFNLCSEVSRHYDPAAFGGRVSSFAFDDHHPPCLLMMVNLCLRALQFYAADDKNVIAIHCKAGKGRAGSAACCVMVLLRYLAIRQEERSQSVINRLIYQDVIEDYGRLRAVDGKGVTIPSQIRYVGYFEKIVRMNLATVLGRPMFSARILTYPRRKMLRLLEVSITNAPVRSLVLTVASYDSYYAPDSTRLLHPENTSRSGKVLYYNLSDVLQTVAEERFSDAEDGPGYESSGQRTGSGAPGGRAAPGVQYREGDEPGGAHEGVIGLVPGPTGPLPAQAAGAAAGAVAGSDGAAGLTGAPRVPGGTGQRKGTRRLDAQSSGWSGAPSSAGGAQPNPVREFAQGAGGRREAQPVEQLAGAKKEGETLVFNNPLRRRLSKPATVHFHGTVDLQSGIPVRFRAALVYFMEGAQAGAEDDSRVGGFSASGSFFMESSEEHSFSALGPQSSHGVSPLRPAGERGGGNPDRAGLSGLSGITGISGLPGLSGMGPGPAYGASLSGRAATPGGESRPGSRFAGDSPGHALRGHALWSRGAARAGSESEGGGGGEPLSAREARLRPGQAGALDDRVPAARRWRGVGLRPARGKQAQRVDLLSGMGLAEEQGRPRDLAVSNSLVNLCDEVYIEGRNSRGSRKYFYTHFNTAMLEQVFGSIYYFTATGAQLDEACKRPEWQACELCLKFAEV